MAQARFYSATAQPTVLTSGITPTTTVINVQQTIGFPPTTPYILALDYNTPSEEIVLVTNAAGTSLTVTRAYDGTSAASHDAGAAVRHTWTAMDGNNSRAHEGSTSGVHGVTGNVVGTTDTQTLTNKTLTSPTISNPTISGANLSNPTITGTVAGGASYTNPTLTGSSIPSPNISGTVAGSATYTAPTLTSPSVTGTVAGGASYQNITATTTSSATTPLQVMGAAGQTNPLQIWQNSVPTTLARVRPTGELSSNIGLQCGASNQFSVNSTGDVTTTGKFLNLTASEGESTASSTTASAAYTDLASGVFSATLTVPPSGKVMVDIHAAFRNSAATNSLTSFNASGSTSGAVYTANDTAALIVGGTANFALSTKKLITGLVAGETLTVTMKHRVSGGTGTWDYRTIHMQGIGS